MFGKNPIRPRENDPWNLAVQAIFPTIQGEGPHAGKPAVFIRLAGCNLACHFCDTEFESGMNNIMAVEAVVAQVHSYSTNHQKLVVITGGEPLRQNIRLLVDMLLTRAGSKVQVVQLETAGTLWNDGLERFVAEGRLDIVCSPKTPKLHPAIERLCHHWKYIVRKEDGFDANDGLPMAGTQVGNKDKEQRIWRRAGGWLMADTVWLSPCDEHDSIKNRANLGLVGDLAQGYGYRVSLQMHKYLGVE